MAVADLGVVSVRSLIHSRLVAIIEKCVFPYRPPIFFFVGLRGSIFRSCDGRIVGSGF